MRSERGGRCGPSVVVLSSLDVTPLAQSPVNHGCFGWTIESAWASHASCAASSNASFEQGRHVSLTIERGAGANERSALPLPSISPAVICALRARPAWVLNDCAIEENEAGMGERGMILQRIALESDQIRRRPFLDPRQAKECSRDPGGGAQCDARFEPSFEQQLDLPADRPVRAHTRVSSCQDRDPGVHGFSKDAGLEIQTFIDHPNNL